MSQGAPLFVCGRCNHQTPVRTPQCPECHAFNSLRVPQTVSPNAFGFGGQPQTPQGPRILNTQHAVLSPEDEFVHTPCGLHVLDKVLRGGVVLGKEGVGTSILFCGPAGVGKTTLALRLLSGLARADHRAIYFTAEQEPRAVLATAKLFGHVSEFLDIVSLPAGPEALQLADRILLQTQAKIAVYDSIQKMKTLAGDIPRPLTRILISRLNKFGEAFGEREQEHDPDTLLWADTTKDDGPDAPRWLRTTKNRHGQLEEAFYWMKDEKIWSEEEWEAAQEHPKKKKAKK